MSPTHAAGERQAMPTCSHLTCDVLLVEAIALCRSNRWSETAKALVFLRARGEFDALQEVVTASRHLRRPPEETTPLEIARQDAREALLRLRDRLWNIDALPADCFDDMAAVSETLIAESRQRLACLPAAIQETVDEKLTRAHREFMVAGAEVRTGVVDRDVVDQEVHREALIGLALSGGGIRSASYCLGAIQALSGKGLLAGFHYLSAVSGGGYAASWLATYAYRHRDGILGVQDALHAESEVDNGPLRWVRRHGSYLAPRLGSLISTDAWALVAGYLASWLPILALLLSTCLVAALLPHALLAWAICLDRAARDGAPLAWVAVLALLSLAGFMAVMRRLIRFYRLPGTQERDPLPIAQLVVFGSMAVSLGLALAAPILDAFVERFHGYARKFASADDPIWTLLAIWLLLFGSASLGAALLASAPGQGLLNRLRGRSGAINPGNGALVCRIETPWRSVLAFLLTVVTVVVMHRVLLYRAGPATEELRRTVAFGPIIVAGLFAMAELLAFVLVRERARDTDIAWFSRLGGWVLAGAFVWSLFASVPLWSDDLYLAGTANWMAAALMISVFAACFGYAMVTGQHAWGYAATTLAVLATFVHWAAAPLIRSVGHENAGLLWLLLLGAAGVTALMAWRLDPNQVSLHLIYKEGLVRTFLGASRLGPRNLQVAAPEVTQPAESHQFAPRRADVATNIDESDNPALAWLRIRDDRKLPILLLNAAVNGRSNLDSEGRVPRQWPFVFSPYFCGSSAAGIGYASTDQYHCAASGNGLSLGTAMAVSGAAVSPNSGHQTRSLRAFLFGVINARLGFWIGNPSFPQAIRQAKPSQSGLAVIREVLAMRDRFGRMIHLSDGGHFENLGLFELLRRGCRRIVLVDASCDPKRSFGDLANAIRRAQIDLGIRIHGHLDHAIDTKGGRSWRWFVIDYGKDLPKGRLLYIKPSLGDRSALPAQVFEYAMLSPTFPHETTADQFFSEAQMEAYRCLGQHTLEQAIEAVFYDPDPELQDPYLFGAMLRATSHPQ